MEFKSKMNQINYELYSDYYLKIREEREQEIVQMQVIVAEDFEKIENFFIVERLKQFA